MKRMKKLLVVGAGFLQDFVIKKAKAMGYETLAVDMDPDAIGFKHADKHKIINIVDEEACYQYAKEENIDGVLTAATDYGVLTAAYIAEKLGLPGISYESAKRIKNKYLVRKCLFENKVDDTAQSYEVNENTSIDEIKDIITYPVIVKPCDGSGSRGTTRVDDAEELLNACTFAINSSLCRKAEIEPFIEGNEYGVESLVVNGEIHVLGVMKKWMTKPPYYAELGHAMSSGLPSEIENKAIRCAANAIKALNITSGSVNMDMIITNEGDIHIVDIGARMGGNMIGPCIIPYGTGISYVENMIRNAVGDELDWSIRPHKSVATRLLTFDNGLVKRLPNFEDIEKKNNVEIYHHLNIGDMVHEYHTNLDGCGYIVVKNDDVDEAVTIAKNLLSDIREYIL